MNERPDKLEKELQSLRPREATPNLRNRIARRIARRKRTRLLLLAGSAAAVIAIIGLATGRWYENEKRQNRNQTVASSDLDQMAKEEKTNVSLENPSPTLWEYRSAVMRSTEAIDGLHVCLKAPSPMVSREPSLTVLGHRTNFEAF